MDESRLEAAFAAAHALEVEHELGALLYLERLPPSHAVAEHRCLGRWAWRARLCRVIGDWTVVEVIDDDPASAILTAVARFRLREVVPRG